MLYQILVASLYVACAVASLTFSKRAVTCVEVGSQATATWTNAAGQQCSFTGTVGITRVTDVAVPVAQDLRWATYTRLIATRTISARILRAQAAGRAIPIAVAHTMLL
ncbi:hypothetical protein N3K66_000388 [Trichothecium roseum]|uniref:Uncharacterized protein n=1 Tax=Trichothecium roseum TaxID=47278 RepID=A0ACC0VC30_9HYPO|nr:hypothetical protein N3K66_000388 [Trichothecium roseum]